MWRKWLIVSIDIQDGCDQLGRWVCRDNLGVGDGSDWCWFNENPSCDIKNIMEYGNCMIHVPFLQYNH